MQHIHVYQIIRNNICQYVNITANDIVNEHKSERSTREKKTNNKLFGIES